MFRTCVGIATSLFLCLFMAVSCKTSHEKSNVREAWDQQNAPSQFDAAPLTYAELSDKTYQAGSLPRQPWSDDYWPLARIGSAHRWINPNKAAPFEFKSDVNASDEDYSKAATADVQDAIKDAQSRTTSGKWEDTVYSSPAEKYDIAVGDDQFGLTGHELVQYAQNRRSYEQANISWGWMGHCHGWAPVSYLYTEPKNSVLMKNKKTGKEVLFTEGDIRGILTKTAADNSFVPGTLFIGTRCNDDDQKLVRDRRGRIVDGVLGEWNETSSGFSLSKPVRIFVNNWSLVGLSELNTQSVELVFGFAPPYQKAEKYWLRALRWYPMGPQSKNNDEIVDVEIFSTRKQENGEYVKYQLISSSVRGDDIGCLVGADAKCTKPVSPEEKTEAQKDWGNMWVGLGGKIPQSNQPLAFKYYKTCRDLNAGAFHSILGRYVSEAAKSKGESHGFVMDITRDDEVWNHPIYAFESKIGEKTPLDGLNRSDPLRTVRAQNAVSVVDVYTGIVFGVENNPRISYQPSHNRLASKILHYTVELDAHDMVVGGEWHPTPEVDFDQLKPASGESLFKELRKLHGKKEYHIDPVSHETIYHRTQDAPDFMWVYNMGSRFGESPEKGSGIKAAFVEALYKCGTSGITENTAKFEIDGKQIGVSYRKCDY